MLWIECKERNDVQQVDKITATFYIMMQFNSALSLAVTLDCIKLSRCFCYFVHQRAIKLLVPVRGKKHTKGSTFTQYFQLN